MFYVTLIIFWGTLIAGKLWRKGLVGLEVGQVRGNQLD